jgi:methionyl aminopeptidase
MTEKDYSGATTAKIGKNSKTTADLSKQEIVIKKKENKNEIKKENKNSEEVTNSKDYIQAGKIANQVKEYTKNLIKTDMLLSEIAEKIEAKIIELKGEVAFPLNLSIDDVAAHYTPTLRDDKKATGLLKVDLGVHVNGCICDIAFSIDLSPDKKYNKLIEASESALKSAINLVKEKKEKITLSEIGKTISEEIIKAGFSPITNLSGHGLGEFDIHSGITIPNYDNQSSKELEEGAFAIEPFATLKNGSGSIYEAGNSNIYRIKSFNQVRDNFSREVLSFILETKKSLPFSQRELERKFGPRVLIAISNLKRAGIIDEFPQLVEKTHQPVSQAETSFIIHNGKVDILVE